MYYLKIKYIKNSDVISLISISILPSAILCGDCLQLRGRAACTCKNGKPVTEEWAHGKLDR